MPELSTLERSYHRLLWAFPRFYRRHRGLEIVTTMMEAARPGQARATRSEAVHLLLSGLRCRLIPPGWAGKVAAVLVTLWAAVVLGGVGAYLAWGAQSAGLPPLDDPRIGETADSLAGQEFSRLHIDSSDPLELAYTHKRSGELQTAADEGWTGARPVPAGHSRLYERMDSASQLVADARQRLLRDGWQAGTIATPEDCGCEVFWASRDGFLLRVSAARPGDTFMVEAYQSEPQGILAAAIAGFLAGAVLAWPMMTWLAQRAMRTSGPDRVLIVVCGVPVLAACLANTVDDLLSVVPDPETQSLLLAADLMYPLANLWANPIAAIIILPGLVAIAAIAVLTPWQRRLKSLPAPG
jgi:hypothetical protein